jgi:hypothetical protein
MAKVSGHILVNKRHFTIIKNKKITLSSRDNNKTTIIRNTTLRTSYTTPPMGGRRFSPG